MQLELVPTGLLHLAHVCHGITRILMGKVVLPLWLIVALHGGRPNGLPMSNTVWYILISIKGIITGDTCTILVMLYNYLCLVFFCSNPNTYLAVSC